MGMGTQAALGIFSASSASLLRGGSPTPFLRPTPPGSPQTTHPPRGQAATVLRRKGVQTTVGDTDMHWPQGASVLGSRQAPDLHSFTARQGGALRCEARGPRQGQGTAFWKKTPKPSSGCRVRNTPADRGGHSLLPWGQRKQGMCPRGGGVGSAPGRARCPGRTSGWKGAGLGLGLVSSPWVAMGSGGGAPAGRFFQGRPG